jgi:6,7-dimethyl-8-ribityllumazine synthase
VVAGCGALVCLSIFKWTEISMHKFNPNTSGDCAKVGIVVSRFNSAIGDAMLASAVSALKEAGVYDHAITVATVPGALETPLALQAMAQTGHFDALVALGAVIRGDTYHFEIVSEQSAAGVSSVQLEFGIPIGNGILTTNTEEQATARARDKGRDAALAALEMANLLGELRDLSK